MGEDKPETEPKTGRDNLIVLTFRLEEEIKRVLDRFAVKQRLPRSVIIRYTIEELLKEEPKYENIHINSVPGRSVVLSFKADINTRERVDEYARNQKASRSEVIRFAVIRFLKEEGVLE
jgi:predicted transcriptional regulator